jgi:hypothetical protein
MYLTTHQTRPSKKIAANAVGAFHRKFGNFKLSFLTPFSYSPFYQLITGKIARVTASSFNHAIVFPSQSTLTSNVFPFDHPKTSIRSNNNHNLSTNRRKKENSKEEKNNHGTYSSISFTIDGSIFFFLPHPPIFCAL